MARVLTNEEYAKLAAKLDTDAMDAPQLVKQSHRLLCEGREVEDLTPQEQFYAGPFKGALCVQIPTPYGWEPGVDVEEKAEAEPKPQKSKKSDK